MRKVWWSFRTRATFAVAVVRAFATEVPGLTVSSTELATWSPFGNNGVDFPVHIGTIATFEILLYICLEPYYCTPQRH
jgi:hypothetical protein